MQKKLQILFANGEIALEPKIKHFTCVKRHAEWWMKVIHEYKELQYSTVNNNASGVKTETHDRCTKA